MLARISETVLDDRVNSSHISVKPAQAFRPKETIKVYIDSIRTEPPRSENHAHITHLCWVEAGTTSRGKCMTLKRAVAWLSSSESNEVWVRGSLTDLEVVVTGTGCLRAVADGRHTNDLINLPRF
ncbi:MAG: hypothetical protein JWP10_685 [Nocardioidaceae bacterium]|nr:hypothetical protein [Nocardioidaceae bacterium]